MNEETLARVAFATEQLKEGYFLEKAQTWLPDSQKDLSDLDQVNHAWEIFGGALRAAIGGGEQLENLQIVTIPAEVEWDDPQFGAYYFHRDAADLINDTGPTYRKTDKSFAERYWSFLRDVLRPAIDEAEAAAAKTALTNADQAELDHADLVQSINLEWQAFDNRQTSSLPPSRWISMERWFEERGRNRVIAASREIVLAKWGSYLHHIQNAFGGGEPLIERLMKFREARLLSVPAPRIDSTRPAGEVSLYPYQISPDYPSWLSEAAAGRHQRVRFTVRHDSYEYRLSRTAIGGGVAISFGFFGLGAVANRRTVSIDTRRTGFVLEFEADLKVFTITPDDRGNGWYDSAAIDSYRDGPFFPGSVMDTKLRNGSLFGPRGFLSFRPARAIVAYNPRVRVQLDDLQYHHFHQVTRGAGGFFIGPFAIGGGGGIDEQRNVRWDDRSFSIELYGGLDRAYLLGFDSLPLY